MLRPPNPQCCVLSPQVNAGLLPLPSSLPGDGLLSMQGLSSLLWTEA